MRDYGTTFTMLWDRSFESWRALGIRSQPSGVLVSPEGQLQATWRGALPEEAILEQVAELA